MSLPELSMPRKLELLLEVTNTISRSRDLEELLGQVMDTLSLVVAFDAAAIYMLQNPVRTTGDRLEHPHVLRRKALRGYDSDTRTELRLESREGVVSSVIDTGQPIISPDVTRDPRYVKLRDATRSEMAAAIVSGDEVIGVFDLESDAVDCYTEEDLRVLVLLASQVAIIVEKVMLLEEQATKKRLEGQLGIARQVQLFLLPDRTPQLENFDIAAYNYSSEEVSGDYYDFASSFADRLNLVIADVSGKGVPAGLLMAFLRGSLRAAMQTGYATDVALTKMNRLLWESTEQNQFVTAIYGTLDSTNCILAFSNAGHNPPLLIDRRGAATYIDDGGLPLGLFEEARYYEYFLRIEPGQIIILYTDGVTEAAGENGVEYGQDRLARVAREGRGLRAHDLIPHIYDDILRHTQGRRPTDDATLLAIRALPAG